MARTNRVKADGDAWYHVMSRTNDRRFLFEGGRVKDELLDALRRAAAFSGVRLGACVAMDNHFHAVVKVEAPSAPVPAEELLRRVGALKGAEAARRLSERWGRLEASGAAAALEAERGRLLARMHDVSEFVKTFKEEFGRAFKRGRPYCGSVWSGRFASTLVEGGEYLRRCVKYVMYNPVRAGLVSQARDYAWSWCAPDLDAGTGPAAGPAIEEFIKEELKCTVIGPDDPLLKPIPPRHTKLGAIDAEAKAAVDAREAAGEEEKAAAAALVGANAVTGTGAPAILKEDAPQRELPKFEHALDPVKPAPDESNVYAKPVEQKDKTEEWKM